MKIYNKSNFFKHTYCIFKEVSKSQLPKEKPDYVSKSKSAYFFTNDGVYRKSNHWGRAANCRWKLISENYKSQNEIIAFARWDDFYPNNETEKLFFIRVSLTNQINFHHKNEILFENDLLRTALETAKRIKIIQEVLDSQNWSKYLIFNDYTVLKEKMIYQLIHTNKSFQELKKEINGTM